MLFSIIIATYNAEDSIEKCLNSIILQSFKDFELIVVDGLSTDQTVHKVYDLFPRAKIICEKDNGIYDALNKGLKLSEGEWIYVLGSDDKFNDEKVLQDVAQVANNNVPLIYGNVLSVSEKWSKLIKMRPPEVYRSNKIKCPPIFHQSAFVNRKYLEETGYYPLFFKIHSDHFLLTRLYHLSTPIYINRLICVYNNQGYSKISWKNYFTSSVEQFRINVFFGTSYLVIIRLLIKNFLRTLLGIVGADFLLSKNSN